MQIFEVGWISSTAAGAGRHFLLQNSDARNSEPELGFESIAAAWVHK
jgi:hypothetical protein